MIISLRGTNGAGKSTLVRAVTARCALEVKLGAPPGRRRSVGTVWRKPGVDRRLFVPGHYDVANGGIDTLSTLDYAYGLIRENALLGRDVLYEGKNMSDNAQRLINLHRQGHQCYAVLLNVPLEECIRSVRARGHAIAEKTIERLWYKSQKDLVKLVGTGVVTHSYVSRDHALEHVCHLLGVK